MRYNTITALFLCFLCDLGCFIKSDSILSHVERYEVVRPLLLRSRSRRSISEQAYSMEPDKQEKYPEELLYQLFFDGNNHTIHLEKNRLLIGQNYTEIHYRTDGSPVSVVPTLEDCYYHGHIQGTKDSSVSLGVCSGMRGFVRVNKQLYLIEPLSGCTEGDHALYKQEYLKMKTKTSSSVHDSEPRVARLSKRSTGKQKSPFQTQRYVELFLVVDNAEFIKFSSNADVVRTRMLEVVNHIDRFYRPHNIRVMLVGLELWNVKDQMGVSLIVDETLTRFIAWRQSNLLKRIKHDNAQFVTGVDFLNDTVGLANKFAMCAEGSGAVNQDHSTSPLGLAATIAHEMGHNLGMSHDVMGCTCGMFDCIMTESVKLRSSVFPNLFSDCSLEELSDFLENANPRCLLDIPRTERLYGGAVCGNAFLEPGEDCDCGTVKECNNPCCNATTCKFTPGSRCAEGECCEKCQIKPAGSVCRASETECDLPEYCTGLSAKCPEDSFKMNGIPCSYGNSYCYNGQCPTHLQHCQRLWGKDAIVAAKPCFFRNTFGESDSHCGRTKNGYRPCAKEDTYCGTIFCIGGKSYPVTGRKSVLSVNGDICRIAGDMSNGDGLSMVPTGTKCGDDKVCFDNKCQDLKVYDTSEDCSLKCNGHGVCDHRKQCHCDPGWAPPNCDTKYADLPSGNDTTAIGVSVAVGLLLILVIAFGCWIYRKNRKVSRCKIKANTEQSSPLYENPAAKAAFLKDRLEISEPMFVESTVNQPCTLLTVQGVPTRPAPQPPKILPQRQPPPVISSPTQNKPVPPSKPMRSADVKQVRRPTQPPVPPGKPGSGSSSWKKQEAGGEEVTIVLPPTIPRR